MHIYHQRATTIGELKFGPVWDRIRDSRIQIRSKKPRHPSNAMKFCSLWKQGSLARSQAGAHIDSPAVAPRRH